MQKNASETTKFLYMEFTQDFPLECRHLIIRDENVPILRRNQALMIGICREGTGILLLEDRVYSFQPDNLIIIPRGRPFCIQCPQMGKSCWDVLLISEQLIPPVLPGRPVLQDAQAARTLRMLFDEWYQAKPFTQHAQQLLLDLLFLQLQRTSAGSQGQQLQPLSPRQQGALDSVYPALARISANCGEKLTISLLAALCHLSASQFQRNFQLATGQSPHAYLISVRLTLAASLLRSTEQTVLSIGERVGFDCISSFNRHFLRAFGLSPRKWRAQNRIPSLPKEQLRRDDKG